MTVYEDRENSVHDGAPIEAYKFTGTFKTYRLTSADVNTTVNSELYLATVIKRRGIKAGTQNDDNLQLELEVPHDIELVQDYAYSQSPPKLDLEVFRAHRGTDLNTDFILAWKGPVSGFNVTDKIARIRVPSIFNVLLATDAPNVYYQGPCNHVLFDARCQVARASFNTTTTVVSADGNTVFVTADGFPDGDLKAGEFVVNRTGEKRLIMNNAADIITLNFPFVDILVGDTVELTNGCDHSFTTCDAKFSNTLQFGGQPFRPIDNPFEGDL